MILNRIVIFNSYLGAFCGLGVYVFWTRVKVLGHRKDHKTKLCGLRIYLIYK
jgi:hypothetical protein